MARKDVSGTTRVGSWHRGTEKKAALQRAASCVVEQLEVRQLLSVTQGEALAPALLAAAQLPQPGYQVSLSIESADALTATVVNIPDANLEAAIRVVLGKPTGGITDADMQSLTYLDAYGCDIGNLSGLEYATNLTTLYLDNNQISDLSALAGLTQLRHLNLWRNEISDISALAGLTQLQVLELDENQIADISALSGMSAANGLSYVNVTWDQLDVSPGSAAMNVIQGLMDSGVSVTYVPQHAAGAEMSFADPNLEVAIQNQLGMPGRPTTGDMLNLTYLDTLWFGISNLSGLEYATNLTYLDLSGKQISDISALAHLTQLEYLDLSGNQIGDISSLSGLTQVQQLDLSGNQISDASALAGLTQLQDLDLGGNQIAGISALSGLSAANGLSHVNVTWNLLDMSSGSAAMNVIQGWMDSGVSVDYDPQHAAGAVVNFADPNLEVAIESQLGISGGITTGDMLNLTHLGASSWGISDLSGLEYATNLTDLYLSDNQISDLSPLVGMNSLSYVDVSYNYLDLSAGSPAMLAIQTLQDNGTSVEYQPQYSPIQLDIEDDSGDYSDRTVLLSSPDIGEVSPAANFRIANSDDSASPLQISNISVNGAAQDQFTVALYDENDQQISGIPGGFTLQPGISYRLEVSYTAAAADLQTLTVSFDSNDWGNAHVTLTIIGDTAVAPANDQFANRTSLQGTDLTVMVDNTWASSENGEPDHDGDGGTHSLWWTWTAPADGRATIDTFGSDFDTVLAVYTGDSVDQLTEVAANDDWDNVQSQVRFDAVQGETYQIAVDGFGGSSGLITLHMKLGAPSVVVSIPDANLEAVIRSALEKPTGDITDTDMQNLTYLDASECDASNLSGLEYATNLTALYLSDNQISDISPLSGLTQLQELDLNRNLISDISALSGLSAANGLSYVDVSGNQLDVTPGSAAMNMIQGWLDSGVEVYYLPQYQPAINDNFADAIEIAGVAGSTTGTNWGATQEADEGAASVWWTWTAPGDTSVTFDTSGSSFDTVLSVYTGTDLANLTLIGSNDDSDGDLTSSLSFDSTSGTTYWICVAGYDEDQMGDIALNWDSQSAPVASDLALSTNEDTVANGAVLASDVDNDALSYSVVANPAHGVLAFNADGTFTYTPASNYNGSDSFTFMANDGLFDSNVGTVSITVTPVNDAPVAAGQAIATNEDTTANGQVLASDVENGTLSYSVVANPAHGSLVLNADGTFTYTPGSNYNGPDSFTFKANDGLLDSNVGTVNITVTPVNDAPVAVGQAISTNEDTAGNGAVVASDVESGALTYSVVANPTHGTLLLNANGTFTYTPASNYNGADSFTFKANDGQLDSNIATVNITVTAVNDAPAAAGQAISTNEDTVTNGTVSASDVENDALSYSVVANPAHGSLVLNADGTFTYTPASNYNGADSFAFKANDGQLDSSVATVSITVTAVNDAPVATGQAISTNEDTPANGAVVASDVENGTLIYSVVANPAHGVLVLNANGTFTYTPASNYNGSDSFAFKANDGQLDSSVATVSITVTPVNDAPVAAGQALSKNEDTVVNGQVLASDVESGTLTFSVVVNPAHGSLVLNADGTFTYTPASNYNGADGFTFKANDGQLDSNIATVNITVTPVNDAPVASALALSTNEDAAGNGRVSASDVDSTSLRYSLVANPAHGVLAFGNDGTFTYTPASNYNGPDSFTFKASDGQLNSNIATVNITVVPVNDAPTGISLSGNSIAENQLAGTAIGALSSSDVDTGDTFTYSLVAGVGSDGNCEVAIDGSGQLTTAKRYDCEAKKSYSIRIRATDAGGSSYERVFAVNVTDDASDLRGTFGLVNGKAGASSAMQDADGDLVTFKLTGAGVGKVYGYDKSFEDIILSGTGPTSALTITVKKAGGDGLVTIGNISSDGLIKSISGTTAILSGQVLLNTLNQFAGKTSVSMKFRKISDTDILVQGLPVSSIAVSGDVANSRIVTTGSIGRFSAGTLLDSDILVGVATGFAGHFAASPGDFANSTAWLGSLKVSGRKLPSGTNHPAYMAGSHISAPSVGTVTLLNVENGSGPVVHVQRDTGVLKVSQSKLTSTAMFESGTWKVAGARPAIWDVV